ncbi:hypothetical protein KDD30_18285 (plasmid) [Photobacterium sp. GJ3]|uniref:hypothetical protein n=1 Tax=Photobacterium sp. GJ3 TaxID=2829502 RepID=UPI001B8A9A5D|nr:hypothetical protein [Photobacterium sp. GJ3]QUJ70096.1 hypothetical protein KDD30_18285 [Photobacterium sp. GJ3]
MKALVAGGNTVLGKYVVRHLIDHGYQTFAMSQQPEQDNPLAIPLAAKDQQLSGKFDVVICCARPVIAPYAQESQSIHAAPLMADLERFAKPHAAKIFTSGIEVFGCAQEVVEDDLCFDPLTAAESEVAALEKAMRAGWTALFVPTLSYGGPDCPIRTAILQRECPRIPVLIPASGHYYAAHLDDLAEFHITIAEQTVREPVYFLAERQCYSPEDLADLLVRHGWAEGVTCLSLPSFLKRYGPEVLALETMHVTVPISDAFAPKHRLPKYLAQTRFASVPDHPQ